MTIQSKVIVYLTIIVISFFISELVPFGNVTAFLVVCAYFVDYFGLKKMFLIWLFPTSISMLMFSTEYYQFIFDVLRSLMPIISEKEGLALWFFPFLFIGVIIIVLAQGLILIYLIHKSMVKLGIYKQFPLL